ncbi:MAG: hypothetical protein H5U40_04150, partial [Polyangiaceae bacterium]|nr:hypothetical protein [Polyangiaceae bacterium]
PDADASYFRGRFYSDKAPGSSMLAAVVYRFARVFAAPRDFTIEELVHLMRRCLMLPFALLGFGLLRALLRRVGTSEPSVDIASLALMLGTAAFHYSVAFYGHFLVTVMLLASLWLLMGEDRRRRWPSLLASGAAAGLAGMTEYQGIVAAALLFVFVLFRERRRPSGIAAFALGAAPFAAALLAYNEAAFGGPFEFSFEHLADSRLQDHPHRGFAGIVEPSAKGALLALFSPTRGLITTAPIVVLFPVGLIALARREDGAFALLLGAHVAYFLAFAFGVETRLLGSGFGPRLLVPSFGALFLAVGPALDVFARSALLSGIARGLAIWGVVYSAAITETFPELPPEFLNPLADVVLPALERGMHAPNLATLAGSRFGVATLYPAWVLTMLAALAIALRGLSRFASLSRSGLALALSLALPLGLPIASAKVFERFGPTSGLNAQRSVLDRMSEQIRLEEQAR